MDIALAVEQVLGIAEYGTAATYAELQRTWRDRRPIPTLSQLQAAWDAYQANEAAKKQARDRLKAEIGTLAQSAVGVRVDQLTAAQQRALVAVLLYNGGGLADDATVRALNDWAE
jgi:hypothetical protein